MANSIFEHRPEFADVRTRAIELEGEGLPLLLLHGFADSADSWRLVLDEMRQRGRAAVALDCPGFGSASSCASPYGVWLSLPVLIQSICMR